MREEISLVSLSAKKGQQLCHQNNYLGTAHQVKQSNCAIIHKIWPTKLHSNSKNCLQMDMSKALKELAQPRLKDKKSVDYCPVT